MNVAMLRVAVEELADLDINKFNQNERIIMQSPEVIERDFRETLQERIKELYVQLYEIYGALKRLYAYPAGRTKVPKNYQRTEADEKRLFWTTANLREQIVDIEKQITFLSKGLGRYLKNEVDRHD